MWKAVLRNVKFPCTQKESLGGRLPVKVSAAVSDMNLNSCVELNLLDLPDVPFYARSSIDNMECVAEPASPETEYILSKDLKPMEEDAILVVNALLERLDSKDWISVCKALNDARRIAIFHASSMLHILGSVVSATIKAMKNPRSALCKTAIMASTDYFKSYQDQVLEFLDPLLLQLLLKASQDKRFVCEEAEKSLVGMTSWISPHPLLLKLQPYIGHRNPRVRAKASMCVCRSVSRLGVKGIQDFGLEALIQIAASQLNDQLPEAREAARQLVMDIREAYQQSPSPEGPIDLSNLEPEQEKWERFCQKQLSPSTAVAVLRVTFVAT